jgi:hypothetical protein
MRFIATLGLLLATFSAFAQTFTGASVQTVDASRSSMREAVAAADAEWVAWVVPVSGITICSSWKDCKSGRCGSASLEHTGFSMIDDPPHATSELLIVGNLEAGQLRRVRLFDAACPVRANGERIAVLTGVMPAASIQYLASPPRASDSDQWLAALALHSHPDVVPTLIRLARHDASDKVRRSALFWLGQKAGAEAAAELRHAVDHDPKDDVREHAVFAISQLPNDRAVPMLIDLVKTHKSRRVRQKAMFWLSQSGDQRALDLIEEILTK